MKRRTLPAICLGLAVCIMLPGERLASLPELVNPYRVLMDEDRLYTSEGATVFIYSRKDHRLLKQFGREGEGPGEFLLHRESAGDEVTLAVTDDALVVSTMDKIVYFNKDGEFIREKRTAEAGRFLLPCGQYLVARTYENNPADEKLYHGIAIYNEDLTLRRTIHRDLHGWQGADAAFNPLTVEQADFLTADNRIFVLDGRREKILIFESGGDPVARVTPPGDRVPFTEADRREIETGYQASPFWKVYYEKRRKMFRFPDHFPPIHGFAVDGKTGDLYTETHEVRDQGNRKERRWWRTDRDGNARGDLWIADGGRIIPFDGRVFRLVENEETETWELHLENAGQETGG